MIVGSGIDLVEIDRIQHSVERYGARFLNKVYTAAEQAYCLRKRNSAESLAARFAAKEAGAKALGTGMSRGVTWLEIEVVRQPGGRPTLQVPRPRRGKGAQAQRAPRRAVDYPHGTSPWPASSLRTAQEPRRFDILKALGLSGLPQRSKVPSRKEIKWSQLKVGTLVLVAIAILIVLVFLMSGSTGGPFAPKLLLRTYFDNAGGLKPGAPVTLEGVTIGNVAKIRVVPARSPKPVESHDAHRRQLCPLPACGFDHGHSPGRRAGRQLC